MAKIKENIKKRWARLLKPYKIIVINPKTFEEKRNWELTRGKALVYVLFFAILLILSTFFTISYTPIKRLVKGYPDPAKSKQTILRDKENIEKIDVLLMELERKENYINNVLSVLKGEEVVIDSLDENAEVVSPVSFPSSVEDSILRAQVEEEEKTSLSEPVQIVSNTTEFAQLVFFKPIEGKLTDDFHPHDGHLGIDIIAPLDEPVKSVLDGTVIFSSWTVNDGHVIQIQHTSNIISVYKHNSVLLKEVGEVVYAGEPISFVGDSGELSSGPHLHFEIWQNGQAINPLNYLNYSE